MVVRASELTIYGTQVNNAAYQIVKPVRCLKTLLAERSTAERA
eukprot:SAG11_NODE_32074_length_286_cov_1.390374_1_plen_42_part_01